MSDDPKKMNGDDEPPPGMLPDGKLCEVDEETSALDDEESDDEENDE